MKTKPSSENSQAYPYMDIAHDLFSSTYQRRSNYEDQYIQVRSYEHSRSTRTVIVIVFGILAIIAAIMGGIYEHRRRRRLDRMASEVSQLLAKQVINKDTQEREIILVPLPKSPPSNQSKDQAIQNAKGTSQHFPQTSSPQPAYTYEQNLSFQNYSRQHPIDQNSGPQRPLRWY